MCSRLTPSRAIHASMSALPKSSGSASASRPGSRRNVISDRLVNTNGSLAPASGIVSGARSIPERRKEGWYSKT